MIFIESKTGVDRKLWDIKASKCISLKIFKQKSLREIFLFFLRKCNENSLKAYSKVKSFHEKLSKICWKKFNKAFKKSFNQSFLKLLTKVVAKA